MKLTGTFKSVLLGLNLGNGRNPKILTLSTTHTTLLALKFILGTAVMVTLRNLIILYKYILNNDI